MGVIHHGARATGIVQLLATNHWPSFARRVKTNAPQLCAIALNASRRASSNVFVKWADITICRH